MGFLALSGANYRANSAGSSSGNFRWFGPHIRDFGIGAKWMSIAVGFFAIH
jgi:hypothetical protein